MTNTPVQEGGCDYCGETGVCPSCGGADIYHDEICVCYVGARGVCPVCKGTRQRPDEATRAKILRDIELMMDEHDKMAEEAERERDEEEGRYCDTCGDRAPWAGCPYRLKRNGNYKAGECPMLTGVY